MLFSGRSQSDHQRLALVRQVNLEHLAERRLVLGLVRPGQRPERQLTEANTNIWHVIEVDSHVAHRFASASATRVSSDHATAPGDIRCSGAGAISGPTGQSVSV